MTTELKQPEALRLADWLQSCAESIEQINAANELRRLYALTQRPAAQAGERDTGPRVLREVFELCEDTMTKMESESTEFSRGRAFEAKGISRAIGTWFQDEFCGRSHMGEPVIQPAAHPLASRCYTMSESHLSGHRLILGFETMEAAQAAHTWVASLGKPAAQATPEPLIVKGAMAGMVDAQVRDLWPTKGATLAPQQATPASAPQSLLMRLAGIAAECSDPDTTDALDALIAATQQAPPEPVGEQATVPRDAYDALERERDYWRTRTRAMIDHAEGTCWYWMGDDSDHPESMVNSLPVVIRADQLRELLARPAPGVPEWFTIDQIADACVQAEISDSKFESLSIALAAQAKGGEHG